MNSLPQPLLDRRAPPPGPRARAGTAYEHLRILLLEGDLGPGDKLSVVELAKRLDCSRVPIMEALKKLEGEGFVQIVPQVGCRVVMPDADEVLDFFILFAAVEGTVSAFAAERRNTEDLEAFAAVCKQIDREAQKAGKVPARDPTYRRLNLMFHTHIHRMARSSTATGVAAGLWDRSDFYIKLAFGSLYFSAAVKRAHQTIRRAIVAGDVNAARATVEAHLGAVGERVARELAR
jgi:DNA-binding GntR family transcriptional regulator